jgi:hypothetical protein
VHVGRRRQHAVEVEEHAVECAQVGKLGKLGCHGFSVVARCARASRSDDREGLPCDLQLLVGGNDEHGDGGVVGGDGADAALARLVALGSMRMPRKPSVAIASARTSGEFSPPRP